MWSVFLRIALILTLVSSVAAGAWAQLADCSRLLTQVGPFQVPVFQFPEGLIAGADHSLKFLFGENSLFLGIHDGHYFLRVGDHTFEGNPLQGSWQTRNKTIATETMLFHFPKVPPKTLAHIRKVLEWGDTRVAMSCVDHVCRVLNESGIPVGGKVARNVLLSPTTLKLIESSVGGEGQEPLEFHLYTTLRNETGISLFKALEEKDHEYIAEHLKLFSRYTEPNKALAVIKRMAGYNAIIDPELEKFIFAILENRESPDIVMGLLSGENRTR